MRGKTLEELKNELLKWKLLLENATKESKESLPNYRKLHLAIKRLEESVSRKEKIEEVALLKRKYDWLFCDDKKGLLKTKQLCELESALEELRLVNGALGSVTSISTDKGVVNSIGVKFDSICEVKEIGRINQRGRGASERSER